MRNIRKKVIEQLIPLYGYKESCSLATIAIEHVTSMTLAQILVDESANLSTKENILLENIIMRLKNHEPIQYILNSTWFDGLEFYVNPSVLIPRPETEELVAKISSENQTKELQLLDIGCGSGCISIALAKRFPCWNIFSMDVSKEALHVAQKNADHHKVSINWILDDVLQPQQSFESNSFDIVVSNPPYITKKQANEMAQNVLSYEPHLALFPKGDDPLVFYKHIARLADKILRPDGKLYFEINEIFGDETMSIVSEYQFDDISITKDINGKSRILSAKKRNL